METSTEKTGIFELKLTGLDGKSTLALLEAISQRNKAIDLYFQMQQSFWEHFNKMVKLMISLKVATEQLVTLQFIQSFRIVHLGIFKELQNNKTFKTGNPVELLQASH